jgi:hypothetical protein
MEAEDGWPGTVTQIILLISGHNRALSFSHSLSGKHEEERQDIVNALEQNQGKAREKEVGEKRRQI